MFDVRRQGSGGAIAHGVVESVGGRVDAQGSPVVSGVDAGGIIAEHPDDWERLAATTETATVTYDPGVAAPDAEPGAPD